MAIEVTLNFLYQLIGQKTVEAAVAQEQATQQAVRLQEIEQELAGLRADIRGEEGIGDGAVHSDLQRDGGD